MGRDVAEGRVMYDWSRLFGDILQDGDTGLFDWSISCDAAGYFMIARAFLMAASTLRAGSLSKSFFKAFWASGFL